MSCGERSSAKGRGQRHALHKTSRKSGLHGQNYDIRDGIKKVPYYSKCYTGRHPTFIMRVLTWFTQTDISDTTE
ncbi:hypothetical protein B5L76_01260 [Enterobacter hormaechei subsp. xiangfangensis]|uniref:Uncharacterized protein n=1 Tax=Enterobacter hormaechei TaxID=158836 RepID=A0AAP8GLL8_9ENTR|nr:hypothetical protein AM432_24185 [Enterobacter cloacae complex sp.]AVU49742.1 hypothetical protein AXJ76_06375 [Enterobacter cloacae]AWQ42632.1 hypothetical protein BET69_06395 [Enterobacter hormaechei]AZU66447.1 hypothetical protein CLM87_06815 [Enterobacter hormaechei subsp. xiangfangensis]ASB86186.1 hypothetical protein AM383_23485 [Enterobacter cloacae complex sp.]